MTELLHPQQLHPYQRECVTHQLTHDDSMLWLQMGLGKTPITLTTIVDRMNMGQVQKTLIFGPLRVIQAVWAREARKWSHTKHLRFSVIHGVKDKRQRALFADADIFLCNYEAMNWLAQQLDHYYLINVRGGDSSHIMHLAAMAYYFTGEEQYRSFLLDELMSEFEF